MTTATDKSSPMSIERIIERNRKLHLLARIARNHGMRAAVSRDCVIVYVPWGSDATGEKGEGIYFVRSSPELASALGY